MGQTAAKEERGQFEKHTSDEKSSATLIELGWNNNRVVYIASNCVYSKPKKFVGVGTKLKESILKYNQINSTVTTRTWVLSTE